MVELHEEIAYVIQPYQHLAPLARRLTRLGVKLVKATPAEAYREVEKWGCGLVPTAAIAFYNAPVEPGPVVAAVRDVPSVTIVYWRVGIDICSCRVFRVTSESLTSVTLLAMLYRRLCGATPRMVRGVVTAREKPREGVCHLLIGDEGLKSLERHSLLATPLSRIFSECYGFKPVFAATTGAKCSLLRDKLLEASRARATLMDVLKAASRLSVSIPLAERYFRSITYRVEQRIIEEFVSLLRREALDIISGLVAGNTGVEEGATRAQ